MWQGCGETGYLIEVVSRGTFVCLTSERVTSNILLVYIQHELMRLFTYLATPIEGGRVLCTVYSKPSRGK